MKEGKTTWWEGRVDRCHGFLCSWTLNNLATPGCCEFFLVVLFLFKTSLCTLFCRVIRLQVFIHAQFMQCYAQTPGESNLNVHSWAKRSHVRLSKYSKEDAGPTRLGFRSCSHWPLMLCMTLSRQFQRLLILPEMGPVAAQDPSRPSGVET